MSGSTTSPAGPQRRRRWPYDVALALFLLVNVVYWQDPWLWRNYVRFFFAGSPTAEERLTPDEEIRGDGSFVIPAAAPQERSIAPEALERMIAYAAKYGSHALLVVQDGKLQLEWYAPHWERSRMTQSQSMHKTLVGLLVGVAIDEGRIGSVQEAVSKYITEWRGDPRGAITIEQMLTMSSGLSQGGFSMNPLSLGMRWLNSGHSMQPLLEMPLVKPPGTRYEYRDINTELLGVILSRAWGRSYSSILRDKLWLPMGGERARVHTDSPGGRAYTSCCLGAPALDWARIGLVLLGRGEANGRRIVSSGWVEQMTRPSLTSRRYGYQTWLGYDDPMLPPTGGGSTGGIATEPFIARDTFFLVGRGQQHVFVTPSRELVIVRLGPALGRKPIERSFDLSVLVNTAIRGMEAAAAPHPPGPLAAAARS